MEKRNPYTEYVLINQKGDEYSLDEIIDGFDSIYSYDTISAIVEEISGMDSYEFIQDTLLNSPLGAIAKGNNFTQPTKSDIKAILPDKYRQLEIVVYDFEYDDDVCKPIELERNNLCDNILNWFIENLSYECGDQHLGSLWCRQLQNFIDAGKWNFGIISDQETMSSQTSEVKNNCNAIMWYGLEGDSPLEEWTIQENGISALIHGYTKYCDEKGRDGRIDIADYAIDYEQLFRDDLFWYFWEMGAEGVDFSKVIKSSPVNLDEIYEMSWSEFQNCIKSLISKNNDEYRNF